MLTRRAEQIAISKTMAFTEKANALRSQGFSVMDYSVGEPDFDTPEHIRQAAKVALDEGHTRYTAVAGILPLRQAISQKLKRENDLDYPPEQICVGTGAKQPLFNVIFAICQEDDEVLLPTPGWVSYEEMVKLAGATPVFVPTLPEQDFELSLEAVERAITPHTKAILINTPNNPTGAVYSERVLRQLAALAARHGFYIISDEVYEKLVYDAAKHISVGAVAGEAKSLCITVNGFSKAYAMTGWRIGYVAAAPEIIAAVKSIQSHTTSSCCSISQYAALEAYTGPQDSIQRMRKAFGERRNYLVKRIAGMPLLHCNSAPGAFYLMLDVSAVLGKRYQGTAITAAADLAELLLAYAHVCMVTGEAFHAAGYLRLCYAVSMTDLKEGMDRIERFLAELE